MRAILTVNFSPWSAYSGGGQQSTHRLACALSARGHDVTVVYTKPPWERVETPAVPYRVRWAALPAVRSRSGAWLRSVTALSVATVVRDLVRDAPAVVHCNGEEGALLSKLRGHGVQRVIATPRYPSFPEAMRDGGWRRSAVRRLLAARHGRYVLLARALDGADLVCPTSASAAAELARVYGLDGRSLTVIPNGVDEVFHEVERSADAHAGPVVFFGRLSREKGVLVLVDALARSRDEWSDAMLVGRGPERDAIERNIARFGLADRVKIAPWADAATLARVLSRASLAVLPSFEESFGNSIAEAMAAGVPVVAARAGSVPELVVDGEHGLLVPAGDADALAEAMRRLFRDRALAVRLSTAARARARDRWRWERTAERCEQAYTGANE